MAYDKQKAHEYYENYTKKGKKKGRKKGKSKKTTQKTTKLVGLSLSGLNDSGKMEAAMIKERLTSEMNAALKGASTPEEKERIRKEYQNKALHEVSNLKSNSQYAKQKSSAKTGSSKSSSKSSSGSKSTGSGGTKGSSGSSKSNSGSSTSKTSNDQAKTIAAIKEAVDAHANKLKDLTDTQKELMKTNLQTLVDKLKGAEGAGLYKL